MGYTEVGNNFGVFNNSVSEELKREKRRYITLEKRDLDWLAQINCKHRGCAHTGRLAIKEAICTLNDRG